ncbi:MAG: DUF3276 family protein [Paludibacteraceae bacterium]|nr:DUF3276 family protein [Paludibacteraceae bacterium]
MEKIRDSKEADIAYSRSVKAGKRIYYLDVKRARNNDLYLCITESKRRQTGEQEPLTFEKHKLFLYKEDFSHFREAFNDVISYVENQFDTIEERQEDDRRTKFATETEVNEQDKQQEAEVKEEEKQEEKQEEEKPQKKGLLGRLLG